RFQHDAQYLYVCFDGGAGTHADRFVSVYLDTNGAGEAIAQADDYSLRAGIKNGSVISKQGTGVYNGYATVDLPGWTAATVTGDRDMAEYAIPTTYLGQSCGEPFGLAVYHQWVARQGNDYGWPGSQFFDQPRTWAWVELASPTCATDNDPQMAALQRLEQASLVPVDIYVEDGKLRSVEMEVPVPAALADDPVATAVSFLNEYADLYQLANSPFQFFLQRSPDEAGIINPMFHVFMGQHVYGIPVYGADLGVHIENGHVTGTNGSYLTGDVPDSSPRLSGHDAKGVAVTAVPSLNAVASGEPKLFFFNESIIGGDNDTTYLAWQVRVMGVSTETGTDTTWFVFLDAIHGDILQIIELHAEADRPGEEFDIEWANFSNTAVYNTFLGRIDYCWNNTTADDEWFNENGPTGYNSANDPDLDGQNAYDFTHTVYHYFYDTFGRRSWDNDDAQVEVMVDVGARSSNNASYVSGCDHMRFRSGWVTLDILAHEFTHGIANHEDALGYSNQSGALNESYADFFAAMIDLNWTIGENLPAPPGVDPVLRSMSNPPAYTSGPDCNNSPPGPRCWNDPNHMNNYVSTGLDNGGVHINNGITNYAAYLITNGDTVSIAGGPPTRINGIGWPKAQRLYYDVLTRRLSTSASFMEARNATVAQARRYVSHGTPAGLEAFTAQDVCVVLNGFAAVGLGTPDRDCNGIEDDVTTDFDGDRIPDGRDNCPAYPNIAQRDLDGDDLGDLCDLDLDGDGHLNDNDNCRNTYNIWQADDDNDGIGDYCDDDDGDGIVNPDDNCRAAANTNQIDTDKDGKGDVCDGDIDADGIKNKADNCRYRYNPNQKDSDGDGVGDVCDNCVVERNPDQRDLPDRDGIGDVCDDDWDNDGRFNDEDSCPINSDPFDIDFNNNGLGLVCDDDEASLFTPPELPAEGYISFLDREAPTRLPIFPCIADGCPNWLPGDTETSVQITLPFAAQARIVDSEGNVVGKADPGRHSTLSFRPRADYFYRPPVQAGQSAMMMANAPAYQGRSYYLEIFPTDEIVIDQLYEMTIELFEGEKEMHQLFVPMIVR
ncbi:MAG: hypothetical protein DWQ04_07475, partial [Chloroflexi bacterium]